MTKKDYEKWVKSEQDNLYSKIYKKNQDILKELDIKVGDIVLNIETQKLHTIIEIGYTDWLNTPELHIFGTPYYKNKNRAGYKNYIAWYNIKKCTLDDIEASHQVKRDQTNAHRLLKYKTDSLYKTTSTLRGRTLSAFKAKGIKKNSKTEQLLGVDFETAKLHIERQFKKGMTWDNHGHGEGKWQIDHVVPLASAKNEDELITLCHYTNLQPLWALDNVKKRDTVPTVQRKLTI